MKQSIKKQDIALNRLKTSLNTFPAFLLLIVIVLSFIGGCASMQQPSGGPRDSIPPKILSEIPLNLTKNFKAKNIEIEFDEYVKLQNEFTEISISPDLDLAPVYRIKRRSLIIELPDSLAENTTYSINFGKGIVDFNEGNSLVNYRYVFATGDEIDSLSVSGNVTSALTKEPLFDVNVMLIPVSQDSIFGKRKANIFTRTDSSGNFRLQNLSENAYRIYALKETNNDRIFNGADEEIAFLADSIYLNENKSGIKLKTFREIPEVFRTIDRRIENTGRVFFNFNRPVKNANLTILDHPKLNEEKYFEFVPSRDTAYMWLPDLSFDSLNVVVSEGTQVLDTVLLRRNQNDKYTRAMTITDNLSNQRVDQILNIRYTASAPIQSIDLSKIKLLEDTTQRTNIQVSLDTANNRQATLIYRWKTKRTYLIELQEGAFIGYFGERSAPGQRKFTFDDTDNYGNITLDVQLPDSSAYIVELIRDNKNQDKIDVVSSHPIIGSQKIVLNQMPGGDYSVRIVYDENKNQEWDTGSVRLKRQPEELWYWNKIITIRPNWEQEELIKVPARESLAEQIQPTASPIQTQPESSDNNAMEEPYIKSGTVTPREKIDE